MTKEEAKEILSGYVKACKEDDFLTLEMFEYEKVIEAMAMGAKALSIPSLPSNLDEAAREFAKDNTWCNEFTHDSEYKEWEEHTAEVFKAGAKWMTEQGETKEGIVVDNNDFIDFEDNSFIDVCPTLDKKAFNLHDGEKVIAQIRKKEE